MGRRKPLETLAATTDNDVVRINGVLTNVKELIRAGVVRRVGANYQYVDGMEMVGSVNHSTAPIAGDS